MGGYKALPRKLKKKKHVAAAVWNDSLEVFRSVGCEDLAIMVQNLFLEFMHSGSVHELRGGTYGTHGGGSFFILTS